MIASKRMGKQFKGLLFITVVKMPSIPGLKFLYKVIWFEPVCAPSSLVGSYYLHPLETPEARAIILHNDLPCNDMCSVIRGSKTYWGAQTEKIRLF